MRPLVQSVWLLIAIAFLITPARSGEDGRKWHSTGVSGETEFEATAFDLVDGSVRFRDREGKTLECPLKALPDDERKQALFDVIGRGVVAVETRDAFDRPMGGGSGFLITRDGYLLTNRHVIRGAATARVKFLGGESSLAVECRAVDEMLDIAVLKVPEVPAGAHVIALAKEKPSTGSTAWTLGYPNGILTPGWGAANGIHSTKELPAGLRIWVKASDTTTWIQTNAVLNSGSSGSPLLNERGQVLGVNTFIAGPQQGFALSIAQASDTYRRGKLAAAMALPLPPGSDEPTMGWISTEIAPLIGKQFEEMQALRSVSPRLAPQQVLQKKEELQTRYRASYLDLARKDPGSWPGNQALQLACDLSLEDSPKCREGLEEVCRLVTQHHLQSRKSHEFTQKVAGRYDELSLGLCRRILESSPYEDVQAHAAHSLAMGRMRWLALQGGMDLKETKTARDEVQQLLGQLQGKYSKVVLGGIAMKDACQPFHEYFASVHVGLPAPAIEGKTATDKELKLNEYRGKVVMLDFFGNYCRPCQLMYPAERKLCESMKGRPFVLLGVNGDDKRVLEELEQSRTITWTSVSDGPAGPNATRWRVTAVPTIFLIDGAGIVRRQFVGTPAPNLLDEAIETLVAETEKR